MDSYTETSSDESSVNLNTQKKFFCSVEGCSAAFAKNRKLTNHLRRHNGERPFTCDHEGCTKNFTNSSHLLRHKRSHLPVEKVRCPAENCGLHVSRTSMSKHMLRKHNPNRDYPFKCPDCEKGFHKKRQLQRHSFFHTGLLPFKCDKCANGFITLRDLNRHKRTHTTYKCECNLSFERWTALRAHRKVCETIKPKCTLCGMILKSEKTFKLHMDTHKEKRDREVFECGHEGCFRFYFHKKNLSKHIQSFHQKIVKPKLSCTYPRCEMKFVQRQKLNIHIKRKHEPEESEPSTLPKTRRDKGIPKISEASKLAGITLPLDVHRSIIVGEDVEFEEGNSSSNEDEVQTRTEEQMCTKAIQPPSEAILTLAEVQTHTDEIQTNHEDVRADKHSEKVVEVYGLGKEENSDYLNMKFVVFEYNNKPASNNKQNIVCSE